MAPTPYTAEQIRDATGEGRRYEWEVKVPGQPPSRAHVVFSDVSAEGATIVSGKTTAGETVNESPKFVRWEELRKHALFPAEMTAIEEREVDLPLGRFVCTVYVVRGEDSVRTFYFAKNLPGAPVYFFVEKGGQRVMTQRLVTHEPGTGQDAN